MNKIIFTGYFGAGNFGDDMMLAAFCKEVLEINPELKLYFFKMFPHAITVSLSPKVKIIDVSKFSNKIQKLLFIGYMSNKNFFLWVGGTVFTDYDGDGAYTLVKLTRRLRKKYGYIGVGVASLKITKRIKRAKYAISHADFITFRDNFSYNRGKELNDKSYLTQDLAYLFLDDELKEPSNVINQTVVSWRELGKELSQKKELSAIKLLATTIIELELDKKNIFILPLDDKNDYEKNEFLFKELKKRSQLPEKIHFLPNMTTKEKFDLIAQSKNNFLGRLHGVFVSEIFGRNTVSISYSIKMDQFLKDLDKLEDNVEVHVLSKDKLVSAFKTNNGIDKNKIILNKKMAYKNIELLNIFLMEVLNNEQI